MKNLIFIISTLLLFVGNSFCQEIRYGIKGGLNLSSINGDFRDNAKSVVGYHFGGILELSILDKFGIQPEILYSREGGEIDSRPTDGFLVETKIAYLKVPVMAKYYFIDRLSAMAGPQFAYLLTAKNDVTPSFFEPGPQAIQIDIRDRLNSFEIGLSVGAEYRLPIGLFAQLRYNVGLANINDNSDNGTLELDPNNKNNVFQASIGFAF